LNFDLAQFTIIGRLFIASTGQGTQSTASFKNENFPIFLLNSVKKKWIKKQIEIVLFLQKIYEAFILSAFSTVFGRNISEKSGFS
jgi:hypothetical protein